MTATEAAQVLALVGVDLDALTRVLPVVVQALELLEGGGGWIAVNVSQGGVRDARVWAHVEGGKRLRG